MKQWGIKSCQPDYDQNIPKHIVAPLHFKGLVLDQQKADEFGIDAD